jgi:hypothetical protein
MAKATVTIRQTLNYRSDVQTYFAANQALFNRVASFYFDVIQAHSKILDLGNMDALRALEQLTHVTEINPHPVMPLTEVQEDIPAMFRRAAINAALGSARSFYSHLARWQKQRLRAKSSRIVHPFRHAPGTNQHPFMQACTKSVPTLPYSSRFGLARVGAGSGYVSLVALFPKASMLAVHNWCTGAIIGICILQLRRRSKIHSK